MAKVANAITPEENPFDSPDPAPIPDQSHIEEKFDESQFSTAQIESMLELARFLYRNGFKLKDRDSALRFVDKLISSDLIRQATHDNLRPENHAEFERLLDRCVQLKTPTEEVYLKLVDIILKILSANQIEIPSDIDDFILNLTTLENFRDNILKEIRSEKHRAKIIQLCELLLANELNNFNEGGVKIAG